MPKSISVSVRYLTSAGLPAYYGTVGNLSTIVSGPVFSYGPHGCDACTVVFGMNESDAFRIVSKTSLYHVEVSDYGRVVWSGRAEQIEIVKGGLRVVAYGYWRALLDQPYTALWSDTKVKNFIPVNVGNVASRTPEKYVVDSNKRLYGTLTKNTVYQNGVDVLEWSYAVPSGSSRQIQSIAFDYQLLLPANWRGRIDSYAANFTSQATIDIFKTAASGALETGSVYNTFTGVDRVDILIFNLSGASFTNTSENGAYYISITNLRVTTTTAATVQPNAIISDMVSLAPALSASSISTNTLDIKDATFEDQYPGDAIDYLAGLGDASSNRWEAGVGADRVLYYRQRGTSSREWYADMLDLDFARSISEMWNSVYAVYKDYDGATLRGTASTDANSVALWGLTRKLAMRNDTTNLTTVNYQRDVLLADKKNPVVKTKLDVSPVGVSDLWQIKSGDYINIRNLPPMNFGGVNFNRFRIERTEYDATNDTLTLQSENPLTSLEFILGRNSAGLNPRDQIVDRDPRIISGGIRREDPYIVDPESGLIPIRY